MILHNQVKRTGILTQRILLIFMLLTFISGLIGYMATALNNPIIRLWKEFYLYGMFACAMMSIMPYISRKLFVSLWAVATFFLLGYALNSTLPITIIIYQIKLDSLVMVFCITAAVIISLQQGQVDAFVKKVGKVFIFGAFLNALFILLQHFYQGNFFDILGISSYGYDTGVKVITVNGTVRAIGLLTGFVQSGTLMMVAIISLIELRLSKTLKISVIPFFIMLAVFATALVFTTYKNGIVGVCLYLMLKLIDSIRNKKFVFRIWSLIVPSIFCFFAISTHSLWFFKIVDKINPFFAYYSIYIRVMQHRYIVDSLHTFKEIMFGVGMGVNGTGNFVFEKTGIDQKPVSLDSTYIYLLSNYGFSVVVLAVIILATVLFLLCKLNKYDIFGARYIVIYTLTIEFFYNNFMLNFPVNLYIILMILIPFFLRFKNRTSRTSEHSHLLPSSWTSL